MSSGLNWFYYHLINPMPFAIKTNFEHFKFSLKPFHFIFCLVYYVTSKTIFYSVIQCLPRVSRIPIYIFFWSIFIHCFQTSPMIYFTHVTVFFYYYYYDRIYITKSLHKILYIAYRVDVAANLTNIDSVSRNYYGHRQVLLHTCRFICIYLTYININDT